MFTISFSKYRYKLILTWKILYVQVVKFNKVLFSVEIQHAFVISVTAAGTGNILWILTKGISPWCVTRQTVKSTRSLCTCISFESTCQLFFPPFSMYVHWNMFLIHLAGLHLLFKGTFIVGVMFSKCLITRLQMKFFMLILLLYKVPSMQEFC